ncbi:DUF3168 domain-containing protein [Herbaspirillum sp. SJZ107]|uniref:DUF3168 domain-containing protein n=1 Tax=Herbaspirillum sp. SJZ107 TaxID=2572881 RepID=UPI0011501704|nr:DUF3168 domain-containing protein [Herbaspirillum sp. SJZ107]TQK10252.1 uncharacterized protein DUF3168 [Herbaspirillum sp. SJZ107]
MSVHIEVREALRGLAGDKVFPLTAPEGTPPPYIVFQVVGGAVQEFVSGEKPEKRQRRVQVKVWSESTIEAAEIAEQVEDSLRAAVDLQPEVLTIPIDILDEATNYRGTMQDFYLFC